MPDGTKFKEAFAANVRALKVELNLLQSCASDNSDFSEAAEVRVQESLDAVELRINALQLLKDQWLAGIDILLRYPEPPPASAPTIHPG